MKNTWRQNSVSYDNVTKWIIKHFSPEDKQNLTRSLTTSGMVARSSDVTSCLSGKMTTFTSSSYSSCSTSKPPSIPGKTKNKRGGRCIAVLKGDTHVWSVCCLMCSPIANLVGFFLGGCPDPELLSSSFYESKIPEDHKPRGTDGDCSNSVEHN